MVESGNNENVPDGDGGKAIGPMQLWEVYWRDAADYDKTLGTDYQQCRNKAYAERVVRAYMARYLSEGATDRQVALYHNGGCNIEKKKGTKAYQNAEKYWAKVKKFL